MRPTTLCRSRNTAHGMGPVSHDDVPSPRPRRGRRRRVHALSGTVRRRRTCGTTTRRSSVLPTGKARPTCIYRMRLPVIYPDSPSHTFLKHPRTRVWTARPGNLGAKRTRSQRSFRRRAGAFGALVRWRDGRTTRYNRGLLRSSVFVRPSVNILTAVQRYRGVARA